MLTDKLRPLATSARELLWPNISMPVGYLSERSSNCFRDVGPKQRDHLSHGFMNLHPLHRLRRKNSAVPEIVLAQRQSNGP
jgi:hypothetical protein